MGKKLFLYWKKRFRIGGNEFLEDLDWDGRGSGGSVRNFRGKLSLPSGSVRMEFFGRKQPL
jgi:hypothetical protein